MATAPAHMPSSHLTCVSRDWQAENFQLSQGPQPSVVPSSSMSYLSLCPPISLSIWNQFCSLSPWLPWLLTSSLQPGSTRKLSTNLSPYSLTLCWCLQNPSPGLFPSNLTTAETASGCTHCLKLTEMCLSLPLQH